MTLYERMQKIAVEYDVCNIKFNQLTRQLRELVVEVRIEKNGNTKAYRDFIKKMTFNLPFKN